MVNQDVIATMLGGRLVQDIQSVTLLNNTTHYQHTSVPANKRWILLGVRAVNGDNVARAMAIEVYDVVARTNMLRRLAYHGGILTTAALQWPSYGVDTGTTNHYGLVILGENNTITATWVAGGASGGSVDADGLVLEYIEIDM